MMRACLAWHISVYDTCRKDSGRLVRFGGNVVVMRTRLRIRIGLYALRRVQALCPFMVGAQITFEIIESGQHEMVSAREGGWGLAMSEVASSPPGSDQIYFVLLPSYWHEDLLQMFYAAHFTASPRTVSISPRSPPLWLTILQYIKAKRLPSRNLSPKSNLLSEPTTGHAGCAAWRTRMNLNAATSHDTASRRISSFRALCLCSATALVLAPG